MPLSWINTFQFFQGKFLQMNGLQVLWLLRKHLSTNWSRCRKAYSQVHESSLKEKGSIEFPLKDVQFPGKSQKGGKEPLRRSPCKQINIDMNSPEPGLSKKSLTPIKTLIFCDIISCYKYFTEGPHTIHKCFRDFRCEKKSIQFR